MLYPLFSVYLRNLLPPWLMCRLDPFEAAIQEVVRKAARALPAEGKVLDAGAGEARHSTHFQHGFYVALDSAIGEKRWDYSRLSLLGDLRQIPLRNQVFDAVLCIVTLEHVSEPLMVLKEFHRVLRPGGDLWLVTPLLWEEHQVPNDYYRYTSHGLRHLLAGSDFDIQSLQAAGGFFQVLARRCINLLTFFQGGVRRLLFPILAPIFGLVLPLLLNSLDGLDRQHHFTLGHIAHAVAR